MAWCLITQFLYAYFWDFRQNTPNCINSMCNQIIKYFGMSGPNINLLSIYFSKICFISIGNWKCILALNLSLSTFSRSTAFKESRLSLSLSSTKAGCKFHVKCNEYQLHIANKLSNFQAFSDIFGNEGKVHTFAVIEL